MKKTSLQDLYTYLYEEVKNTFPSIKASKVQFITALREITTDSEIYSEFLSDNLLSNDKKLRDLTTTVYHIILFAEYNEDVILSTFDDITSIVNNVYMHIKRSIYKVIVIYSHKLDMEVKIIDTSKNEIYHLNYVQAAEFFKELIENLDIVSYKAPEMSRPIDFSYMGFCRGKYTGTTMHMTINLTLVEILNALKNLYTSTNKVFRTLNYDKEREQSIQEIKEEQEKKNIKQQNIKESPKDVNIEFRTSPINENTKAEDIAEILGNMIFGNNNAKLEPNDNDDDGYITY